MFAFFGVKVHPATANSYPNQDGSRWRVARGVMECYSMHRQANRRLRGRVSEYQMDEGSWIREMRRLICECSRGDAYIRASIRTTE